MLFVYLESRDRKPVSCMVCVAHHACMKLLVSLILVSFQCCPAQVCVCTTRVGMRARRCGRRYVLDRTRWPLTRRFLVSSTYITLPSLGSMCDSQGTETNDALAYEHVGKKHKFVRFFHSIHRASDTSVWMIWDLHSQRDLQYLNATLLFDLYVSFIHYGFKYSTYTCIYLMKCNNRHINSYERRKQ